MLQKFGCLVFAIALALPALAAERTANISGYVRNTSGVPQMGAVVEILSSSAQALEVFTDENGFYAAVGLLPGVYNVRASAPSFLPALRDHIGLHPGASLALNLTLTTLFDAIQLAPARGVADNDDDWKWVLRSQANRPLLRFVDDDSSAPPAVETASGSAHELKGTLSLLAGSASEGYGSASEMGTGFSVERSIFSSSTVSLDGNLGYGVGAPSGVLRASYSHLLADGSSPQVTLTMRSLPSPDGNLRNADLQAFALSASDKINLGDAIELSFGSELQTIQFMGRVTAFRPFGTADVHLSPNTVVEYRYATSEPDTRIEKGFDTAPADLSESGPRVTMVGFNSTVEHAHHHEVSVSHREGKTKVQAAVYFDRISDPALVGVGEFSTDNGNILPDLLSGTFTYQGKNLDTRGLRLVLQRQLASTLTATIDYENGGVLDLDKSSVNLDQVQQSTVTRNRQSVAGKLGGTLPHAKTHWVASYRVMNGSALTPVDIFNASAGQASPYFNLFIRQPIPQLGFLPCHMEAMLDVRNLLAQGYVPVMGSDGHTVYLVQSARAIRGGLAFTF
jgi:hypothetical protein